MLSVEDILQPENVSYTDNVWTWAVAHMLHKGEDWQITTITDTAPIEIVFLSKGEPFTDYTISGNTLQDGTPTPEAPVDVVGCGARTGNLFDYLTMTNGSSGYLKNDGTINPAESWEITKYIPVSGKSFTLVFDGINATPSMCAYDLSKNFITGVSYNNNSIVHISSESNIAYIRFSYKSASHPNPTDLSILMLNAGSTSLPYVPYGYKLDISSGGMNLCAPIPYKINYYIDENGVETSFPDFDIYSVSASPNTTYTLSLDTSLQGTRVRMHSYSNGSWMEQIATQMIHSLPMTFTTPQDCDEIRFSINQKALNHIMLNLGSTALPYEPYNRIATPIYLGSCQSTRRINKRVLTGGENWTKSDIAFYTFISNAVTYGLRLTTLFCSHYQCIDDGRSYNDTPNNSVYSGGIAGSGYSIYFKTDAYSNVDAWKQWLADQYAAGTPVTVWYVMSEPETGIVNEPLHKIGDYADTITMAQAGVTIPTIAGTNTLLVDTTVQPSSMSITGKIREAADV